MLRLFNTLGRAKQDFTPLHDGEVSFYTCGPTVYNYAHIGNFRAYIAADLLRRWLTHGHNLTVKWVMNITDVDDKTIRDSQQKYPELSPREALQKFTSYYEQQFFADLADLNIHKTDFAANPRATEYIAAMQALICKIHANGFAKITSDGVFFDVAKWSAADKYGKLVDLDLSQLKSGTRALADEIEKENVADFALWKAAKAGEPSWDFELDGQQLAGRPGWHIECSAMESELFELPFDIHSGGVDLCFPHHEDEIAQSKCGYGCEPTAFWLHNEHLQIDGKKMSKSLGNFYTLRDLLAKGHTAEAIRYFLATNHYRTKLNLTEAGLHAAQSSIKSLRAMAERQRADSMSVSVCSEALGVLKTASAEFYAALDDDLNVSAALAVIFITDKQLRQLSATSAPQWGELLQLLADTLGIDLSSRQQPAPAAILTLAEQRQQARANRDFARSDELRDELAAQGWQVLDTADGFELQEI